MSIVTIKDYNESQVSFVKKSQKDLKMVSSII